MTLGALAVTGLFVVLIALAGDQLARLPITAPMLAVGVGLAVSLTGSRPVSITLGNEEVLLIAEVTLVVLLFSDASRIFTIVVGGNGFIAAFTAGIALRLAAGERCDSWLSLSENFGQLGAIVAVVMFGATMVEPALDALTWRIVLTAIVLLTAARMIPSGHCIDRQRGAASHRRVRRLVRAPWPGFDDVRSRARPRSPDGREHPADLHHHLDGAGLYRPARVTAAPLARLCGTWLDSHPRGEELCEHFTSLRSVRAPISRSNPEALSALDHLLRGLTCNPHRSPHGASSPTASLAPPWWGTSTWS